MNNDERAVIYDFLAQIFMEPIPTPGSDYAMNMLNKVSALIEAEVAEYPYLAKFLDDSAGKDLQDIQELLAIDRTALCRGVSNAGPLPPYSSFYTKQISGGEALLSVMDLYGENGFSLRQDAGEKADYIGLELAFTAELLRNNKDIAAHDFIQNHLSPWVQVYCKEMGKYAKTAFFKGIAEAMESFLKQEAA